MIPEVRQEYLRLLDTFKSNLKKSSKSPLQEQTLRLSIKGSGKKFESRNTGSSSKMESQSKLVPLTINRRYLDESPQSNFSITLKKYNIKEALSKLIVED